MRKFPPQYTLQPDDVLYFSHIPKTAGMTFRTILEDRFHCDEVCPATLTAHLSNYSAAELEKYRLFKGHLAYVNIPKLVPHKNVINVNVLRDPVPRVISHYDYIRRMPGDPHYAAVQTMTLEEFSQSLPLGRVGKNVQTYYIAKLLQFDLNHLPPDEVLALAKQSLDQLAFVGLLERFQDSLFLLSYIFGWKPILNSRRENAASSDSKTKRYEQIQQSTIDLIKENTALDLELYEYAREIFETRFDQMNQELVSRYASDQALESPALSTDQLYELLGRHCEHRYVEQQLPLFHTLRYDFRDALQGTGWHRREYINGEAAYRWIGPDPAATLDLPLASDSDLMVEVQTICTYATTPQILDSLTLKVGESAVPLVILYSDKLAGIRLFQGVIPRSTLEKSRVFTQLTFQVDSTVAFKQVNPNSRDLRVAGIAIDYVKVFPVPAEMQESASLALFTVPEWEETVTFLEKHVKPDEKIIAPLAFKLKFPDEILDVQSLFRSPLNSSWVVLYKGLNLRFKTVLIQLILHRFSPVFANGSFVVFSTRRDLPQLSYQSEHVKGFYWDLLQPYFSLKKQIKQLIFSLTAPFRKEL